MSLWHSAALVLVVTLSVGASAEENAINLDNNTPEVVRQVFSSLQNELTECSVYFSIAGEALRTGGDEDAAKQTLAAGEILSERAYVAGTAIGMNSAAMLARMKWALNDQYESIDGDLINMAVLIDRYAYFCKALFEDSDSRIKHLLSKELSGDGQ